MVYRKLVAVVVGFAALGGCGRGGHPDDTSETLRRPLVTVSAPFEVEGFPPVIADPYATNPPLDCGSVQCFGANVFGLSGYNIGTRFDATANGIGPRIRLADNGVPNFPATEPVIVSAKGDDFLVASSTTGFAAWRFGLEKVRGSDGARSGYFET